MRRVYLDHNATAPVRPEVVEVVAEAMGRDGNAQSVHGEGRAANARVEEAREQVRRLVNAPANGVIFTSGGTEAIHLALNGLAGAGAIESILVSALEHPAVSANAAATGLPVETIPALRDGLVDLDALSDVVKRTPSPFLFCLMMANNETGAIQPVQEASEIVHEAGGLLFVDAAQAAGKIPVNFVMSGADAMAVTGHKFGGPVGVGALAIGPNLPLSPVMRGGGHEMNRRAGTHNTPAIAGLGLACELAEETLARAGEIAALRDQCQIAAEAAGAKIWARDVGRLPGTLCLSADGFAGETQLMVMDLAGVALSSGAACSSGKAKPSHVLEAMGASERQAKSSIRVSLGWSSSEEDATVFCREWPAAYDRVKARAA